MRSTKRNFLLIFLFSITSFLNAMNTSSMSFGLNLPDTLDGWIVSDTLKIDSREMLYDYIDGGAEQFISYGFVNALVKTFIREGETEVRAEVFDMGNAKNAYGIFSNIRYDENSPYGQGAQYVNGTLFFWKGSYFINISANDETTASKKFVNVLATYIDNVIQKPGEKPGILRLLPEQGLDHNGIMYFHHFIWQNAYYFISNENILLINDSTEAVYATYGSQDDRLFLLIVKYQNEEDTKNAYDNFLNNYFDIKAPQDTLYTKDNKWTGIVSQDDFIVGVFNGSDKVQVSKLVQRTVANIKNRQKESRNISDN